MSEEVQVTEVFEESSSTPLEETVTEDIVEPVENEEDITDLIVKTLQSSLELKDGCSESLTSITSAINDTYAECTAATVHECLVRAFPDLQAQQSSDHEEVFYLGIKLNSYLTSEERVVHWLTTRFKEDQFGSISVSKVSDIASKEIGFHRSSLVGNYLRKAFPNVYVRRSDRLRWYCGISLPEKVLTEEEKRRIQWMEEASHWLRENVSINANAKEKCSLIFAALVQFVGKISIESCLAVVKCVFPSVRRKTYDRQAFYVGIELAEHLDRDSIMVSDKVRVKNEKCPPPIITEEERETVTWLKGVLRENVKSRERLRDITTMLIAKQGENVAEKDCLKFLRKAFPNIGYRRRDNVACVTGVEIKANFRPKEPWLDKAVAWLKEVVHVRGELHCEKYGPIIALLKRGLRSVNQNKIHRVFQTAFPDVTIKKTHDGRVVYGIGLVPNYHQIAFPAFTDEDYIGDFSDVDMGEIPDDDELDDDANCTMDHSGMTVNDTLLNASTSGKASITISPVDNNSFSDTVKLKKLEDKIDQLTKTIDEMSKEMTNLREELAQSSRQKDSLIVQLQQTLVLLTQQHYSKLFKSEEDETEEVVDVTIDQNGTLL